MTPPSSRSASTSSTACATRSSTILFVTHDMGAVNRFCHRALLLDRGKVVAVGDPREVGDRYLDPTSPSRRRRRRSSACAPATAARGSWTAGSRTTTASAMTTSCRARATCSAGRVRRDRRGPVADRRVRQRPRAERLHPVDDRRARPLGAFRAGERAHFAVRFANYLAPGATSRWRASPSAAGPRADRPLGGQLSIVVVASPRGGVVDVPCEWQITGAAPTGRSRAPPDGLEVAGALGAATAARRSGARPPLAGDCRACCTLTLALAQATSSCASSARCSATCGSSCAR